ncbi:MAG: hypothetical protein J0I34_07415 [Pseudonocardia sp.]|nr:MULTISPECIES: hypothetical protein [Actinomycetes]MBN9108596.1 hypothetical protein [Pseudonocardia sp.]ODU27475.1 MAG: hypothetical protein ABS80_03600 [Pseudonocardia sp. SCN 72-51]ODV07763.1 MAG: hypothetical protein ABT15_06720 [Pseudonocardia sp. SCN 73-27]
MDSQQVRQLLAVVIAYDNRKLADANILAWTEAARRGRWTLAEAVDAVHEHYASQSVWLMPGHVSATIRARRQDLAQREQAGYQIAAAAEVRELVAGVGRHVDDVAEHEPAPVPSKWRSACPHCHAGPGAPCVRPSRDAAPVALANVHPSRLNVAAS